MLDKIRQTIQRFGLIERGDRIVVAVSGGADSVCLLKVMRLLVDTYGLTLSAAHLNHGLRGEEAKRDQLFVERLCGQMGIALDSRSLDIPALPKNGRSLEEICRNERYSFLNDVLKGRGYNKVALGHNADDRVETMWINLLRGSGVEGLKGFLPCREGIYIRPLFEISRQEILTFLEAHSMDFVVDSTNRENVFLRNRIRRELIPLMESSYNPRIKEGMLRLSDILRDENDFMAQEVECLLDGAVDCRDGSSCIDISFLTSQHPAIQKRIVKNLLERHTPDRKGIQYGYVEDVLRLARSGGPSDCLDLGASVRVRRQYNYLIISKCHILFNHRRELPDGPDFKYEVVLPGIVEVKEADVWLRFDVVEGTPSEDPGAVFMDYDKVTLPMTVRNIVPGDRIQVFRISGMKKVSDLLIDQKVPRTGRGRIPVVADQNEVLWVAGIRLSEKVRITAASKKVIKAEIV